MSNITNSTINWGFHDRDIFIIDENQYIEIIYNSTFRSTSPSVSPTRNPTTTPTTSAPSSSPTISPTLTEEEELITTTFEILNMTTPNLDFNFTTTSELIEEEDEDDEVKT